MDEEFNRNISIVIILIMIIGVLLASLLFLSMHYEYKLKDEACQEIGYDFYNNMRCIKENGDYVQVVGRYDGIKPKFIPLNREVG